MIPLVRHDFVQTVALGPDGFDLLGRSDQRLDAHLRVALIGVLHGHSDDRPVSRSTACSAL